MPDGVPYERKTTGFTVLLGGDYAGKSSAMAVLARSSDTPVRLVSTDDRFLDAGHEMIGRLRRDVLRELLPAIGGAYSPDFLAVMLQTAVVHLRDQVHRLGGRDEFHDGPILVDSYYYKILAKCRLAGACAEPLFDWWRSFPQPDRILYLQVSPETAWQRSGYGRQANRLEHYGRHADRLSFGRFQADLSKLMAEEIRHLPVTTIEEQRTPAATARAIQEVLFDDRH